MDWKEFVASLVSSLAWPAVVAFTVYLVRRPLRHVIVGLRKVKYRDWEADFEGRVRDADAAAQRAELPATPALTTAAQSKVMALSTRLAPQVTTDPRGAVITAWLITEQEVESLARAAGIEPGVRIVRTQELVQELEDRGVIDAHLAEVLDDLRGARNAAAHQDPFAPDPDDVISYIKLAGRAGDALREIRERLESEGGSQERN